MKAVILAAGRGTRMGNLTDSVPKPMLRIAGKTLLEHKLDVLPDEVDEVVIIIGYLGHVIKAYFGHSYYGKKITYVEQKELLGTGHSLWQVKDKLTGKFMVMMGDDIYSRTDILNCLKRDFSILVKKVPSLVAGGKVVIDEEGKLKDIIEGSNHGGMPGMVYTGLCVLQPEIFKYPLVKLAGREEYGLPQTFLQAVPELPFTVVESHFWLSISSPEDLARSEVLLTDEFKNANLKTEKVASV